jgi:integrase
MRGQGRKQRKRWSWAAGEYGGRVRVYANARGWLYGCVPLEHAPGEPLRYKKQALKHKDRERAKAWARDESEKMAVGLPNASDAVPTVARVFAIYKAKQTPRKGKSCRAQDARAVVMFTNVLGAGRDLSKLTLGEWTDFIDARGRGAIGPRGEPVPEKDRQPVGARAVENDCEWLDTVLRWATQWQDAETGKYLLRENPIRGELFRRAVPHEQNPQQPVASQDRFEATLTKSGDVHPYLPAILALVNGTGRRIRAVLALRYQDLELGATKAAPQGAISWPGDTDKMGKSWSAPISKAVRAALDATLAERPGIGGAYLFPRPTDATKPVSYEDASKWLRAAEKKAKLAKLKGSLWHAYRRKWGTERKGLPVQDVAAAGGWKDIQTLQRIYQQPDPATLYRVVTEATELREAQHG